VPAPVAYVRDFFLPKSSVGKSKKLTSLYNYLTGLSKLVEFFLEIIIYKKIDMLYMVSIRMEYNAESIVVK
jgi:hypothetical protein